MRLSERRTLGGTKDQDLASDNLMTVAKGGGFLAAGDLLNYASRFIAALVLARVLDADAYGLYTLSVSLAFVAAGIANLGMDAAAERFVAVLRGRGDEGGVEETLRFSVGLSLLAALMISTVGFFAADSIARGVFEEDALAPLLRMMAFIVPFLVSTTLLASIVRGFKRMDYSAFAENLVQPLVRISLIGLLAFVGLTAEVAVVIFGISYLLATAVLVKLLRGLFRPSPEVSRARQHSRDVAVFAVPFWFSGLLNQLRRSLQPILLGIYSTVANVGIFSLVSSANVIGRVAIMAIRKSLRPTLAQMLDQENRSEAAHLYQATTRWTLTANLPVSLVMILYPTALLSLFGERFEAGATALILLALAEVAKAASGTCGVVIDMSGLNLVKMVNKTFHVTLTLLLNVIFIVQWGLVGAAAASLVGTIVIQLIRLIEVRVLIGLNPYDATVLKPVAAAIVAFTGGWGLNQVVPATNGAVELALNSAVVGGLYVAAIAAFGFTEEDRSIMRAVARRARLPVGRGAGR